MKYLPPCALGNCILRSSRLPRPCAFPRIGNRRGGALIPRPHGAAHHADKCTDQRAECEHRIPVETRLAASHTVSKDEASPVSKGCRQYLHERVAPWFGAAICTFCPSSSESDGLMMIRSLTSRPPRISSVAPKSRPMLIGRKCTVLSLSTTATLGPSARNSMAFTGIVILGTEVPVAKCTWPKEPGSSLPSLLGTSTSVFRVRVAGSMASAVRATAPVNFWPGNSCSVTVAFIPVFIFGAYACGTLT